MKAFILVLFMQSNFGGGPVALPTTYKTLAECNRALAVAKAETEKRIFGNPLLSGICVPRGTGS